MNIIANWLIAGIVMLVASLMIWSRRSAGKGMSGPPEKSTQKSLEVFIETTPQATTSQQMLFYAGNRLFLRNDFRGARKVYEQLLEELPGNRIVQHNIALATGTVWVICPHCGTSVRSNVGIGFESDKAENEVAVQCVQCGEQFQVKVTRDGQVEVKR